MQVISSLGDFRIKSSKLSLATKQVLNHNVLEEILPLTPKKAGREITQWVKNVLKVKLYNLEADLVEEKLTPESCPLFSL